MICRGLNVEGGKYGDTIEALQRVAVYLGPGDKGYEEVGCACDACMRCLLCFLDLLPYYFTYVVHLCVSRAWRQGL